MQNEPNNFIGKAVALLLIACAILIAALLSSCNPTKQIDKHPELAAQYCADKFPVRETVIHDTLWNDSTRLVYKIIHDTTWLPQGEPSPLSPGRGDGGEALGKADCEQAIRTIEMLQNRLAIISRNYRPPVHTTIIRTDSAAIKALQYDLAKANAAATIYLQRYQDKDMENIKLKKSRRTSIYLNAATILILLGGCFFAFKRKTKLA